MGRTAMRQQFPSGWRPVMWNILPGRVVRRGVTLTHNATLRDPAHFVLGNVPAGWQVDITASSSPWVRVYVPILHRWGYIERAAIL